MAYLSISGRLGNIEASEFPLASGDKYFNVEMQNGLIISIIFSKEQAAQWAAKLTEAFDG